MDREFPYLRPVPASGQEAAAAASAEAADESRRTGITPPTRRGGSGRFLTDVIVELGYVDRERADAAVEAARQAGRTPEQILQDQGLLNQDQLAQAVAERYGLDHLDLNAFQIDMGAANLISASAARRYEAVPVSFLDERTVVVAMVDPANVLAIDDIAIMTGMEVRPGVASREDVTGLITRLTFRPPLKQVQPVTLEPGAKRDLSFTLSAAAFPE